ncbi:MAG: histidine ammonia-lyase [Flavobacteriales bacterium]|mgnify:CR=1 FL=1|nr:histidine ammonia-lyase [Flavobacteriales bacterium]MBK7248437.1 histidine ammonia-lyase [Flavobacteriales bacterium]MBK9059347.1 histidine ammonia-lyase [Flavobacteriales bacterium]HQV37435.1 histidine ammonia-lyase [Flavobacteriales bacterium]HQW31172.1 histidine ammonia-lyase [Flavobacteriales bacterium]
MSKPHQIGTIGLELAELGHILSSRSPIALSKDATAAVKRCHAYLRDRLKKSDAPIYGVNTGFGALADTSIPKDKLAQLQKNLVMSHACGTGDPVPAEIVRAMLVLKVQNMAFGHSAVAIGTVQRYIDMHNADMLPVVYERGSLGASGDLAPLAHLALPLIGLGEVVLKGKRMKATKALKQLSWEPLELGPKEGLALLNGTQFMCAYASLLTLKSNRLAHIADVIAAMSLDAFDGRTEPFHASVHAVRPHPGQAVVAGHVRDLLKGSDIAKRTKKHVQDPYSFRCVPQVHGASRDTIAYVERVVERELESVTDNPTVFDDEDLIMSAGNFHGQPLALALDFLAIALAEFGSISERRTYKLLSGQRGLPAFLVAHPGLNSGFMIPQYASASLVSANKQRCMPNSVDTIDSSNGQEDHVSMGAAAAIKTWQVAEDVERILAIELFTAAQALDFRKPLRSSKAIEALHASLRKQVPFVEEDVVMHELMENALAFVRSSDRLIV